MTDIEYLSAPALLGECPVWSSAEQVLYWEDIDGKAIHRYDPATGIDEQRSLPGRPGSFVLTRTPGTLLVGMEHELVWFDWHKGLATPFVAVEEASTGNRLNDGRCDPAGRYVVGSMYEDTSKNIATGILHRVTADGATHTMRTGIGVTNGLAFDAERRRMYFADTPTETVLMWDYDVDTGVFTDECVFFDYTSVDGKPDGACLDADGCYWSASVYGWALTRITPDGVVDRRIELPVRKPSMPAFGGPDLSTLYITTIGDGGSVKPAPGENGEHAGALLAIDVGVQGRPEPVFAGAPPTV